MRARGVRRADGRTDGRRPFSTEFLLHRISVAAVAAAAAAAAPLLTGSNGVGGRWWARAGGTAGRQAGML